MGENRYGRFRVIFFLTFLELKLMSLAAAAPGPE
jgi:hypothetical protein|tara:strand:+ start:925 stop:1026 length:102 start_codon:yes stop_codon:yes gene_type:complete